MKKPRHVFLFFVFFLAFLPAFTFASPFTMISAGDPALEDLRFLAIQSGKSLLSLTPPLSRDEALLILQDIGADNLSPAGEAAYNRVMEALNPKPLYSNGFLSVDAHIQAGVEARVRTNPGIPWTQNVKDSPPLLELPVNVYAADKAQLFIASMLGRSRSYFNEAGVYVGSNIPTDAGQIDVSMPLRAFFAIGGAWWNFEIGRDRLSYGLGRSGNMAVSDTPDYYDMARFSVFSSTIKYSLMVSQMPLVIEPIMGAAVDDVLTRTTQRHLYVHMLDFRLFKSVSFGFTEGMMVGDSPLELRFLNPLAIFHSFAAWRDYDSWGKDSERSDMVGSLFSLDVNWAVLPSLVAYGQFALNEWSTPYELEHWPDAQAPNATGFLAGLEYARDIAGWGASFYVEYMYADPYFSILSTPFASYIWMRRISDSEPLRYTWIGHPAGRDAILYMAGARFSKENLGFCLNAAFTRKGQRTLQWDWEMGKKANAEKTPSGIPENTLTLAIGSNWKPFRWLKISAQVGGSFVFDYGHTSGAQEHGFDAMISVQFTY
ncbi:MAG: capsule assembly Wzi family protein [Treponema sp.]|nr:capsule assembly Wzi family protein [Treponema sp.]